MAVKLPACSRRRFLATAAAAAFAPWNSSRPALAELAATSSKHLRVTNVDRITIKAPYREIPARNMARELPHWQYADVFRVSLQSGHTGFGENLLYYTWGASSDEDAKRVQGRNAAELMWDDSLGAGLQIALFDAVARAAEVPVHRLLGHQTHARTPLSWWNIDTSAEDMVAECRLAEKLGYRAYKTKGRPWFDVWKQVESVSAAMPDWFKLDMDYNDTLLDAKQAIPILKELEQYPQIDIYETPIPQADIPGNQAIRAATRVSIAMHYGSPEPRRAITESVCDGFVIGGGAASVMKRGHVAEMADMPFWLQLVGTDITTAFSLHLGGVLSHATWPAVNCHQLYQHSMLQEPIVVKEGHADVPDKPGLGFELDLDTVMRLKVPKPARRPEPKRLLETRWPDGRRMYVANNGRVNFMLDAARLGKTPFFERGVTTRLIEPRQLTSYDEIYQQARQGPVMKK